MKLNKAFFTWLVLIVILLSWWWHDATCTIICVIKHDLLYETWEAGWYNPLLFVVIAWAMWYCHEKFGWFDGRASDSEVPRMHVHPKDDTK